MTNIDRLVALGMVPELAKEVAAQIEAVASSVSGLTAANIAFTPAGSIEATNVQDAIEEVAAA